MSQNLRKPEILRDLDQLGKVTVEQLMDRFDISAQTARRDLKELADEGLVERVYGGAIRTSALSNIEYEERRQLNEEGKIAIAGQCVEHVPNGSSIFINIGTTTEAVARELREHKNMLVVTNSIHVANILTPNEDCEILVTSGRLRRADGGLLGDMTNQIISNFKFDIAIISCAGIDAEGDLLEFDLQETQATKAIMAQSRRVFVVAEHTKFGRSAPGRVGSLKDVHTIFTDGTFPNHVIEACTAWNTRMISASDTPLAENMKPS